jgi:hypothetical protein
MSGGEWMKYFAGVPNPGELSFEMNWDPKKTVHSGSTNTGLWGSFNAYYNGTDLPRWQYQNGSLAGGTATFVFRGFVQDMTPMMGAVQGSVTADVTIKVSGKPTLTIS